MSESAIHKEILKMRQPIILDYILTKIFGVDTKFMHGVSWLQKVRKSCKILQTKPSKVHFLVSHWSMWWTLTQPSFPPSYGLLRYARKGGVK